MSLLINAQGLSKRYAAEPLFHGLDISIHEREKIALVGGNGVGKSTLLKILSKQIKSDEGQVVHKSHLKVSVVNQVIHFNGDLSVRDACYQYAVEYGISEDEAHVVASIQLSLAGFQDENVRISSLSGGWKKRLSIACSLIGDPDLVFFDEPTNHLDLDGVLWLQDLMNTARFSWVTISHDRWFLSKTARKVWELNTTFNGGILELDTNYEIYRERRLEVIASLVSQAESLANKVRREKDWLSRQPKARTTKSRSRIDEANNLMGQLSEMKQRLSKSKVDIDFQSSGRKTKKLMVLDAVTKQFGDKKIVDDLSVVIPGRQCIGLLGKNGSGKSTVLKMLTDELAPTSGSIWKAPDLKVVYFDQNRDSLDPNWTVKRALSEFGDSVIYQGRSIHIVSWARKFNFDNEDLGRLVGSLSGGEQARILISRLMQQEADVLVLDEPTNDVDLETLEILEESLISFTGAIVLVTHDRYMISRLGDVFIGLDGTGAYGVFASYEQWERSLKGSKTTKVEKKSETVKAKKKAKKLSYMEQREYDQMEGAIQKAEADLESVQEEMNDPQNMSMSSKLAELYKLVGERQSVVEKLYARWEELEAKKALLEES